MRVRHKSGLLATVACVAWGALAAPAQADFHLMQIREINPGPTAGADFFELQMYAPGQNLVGGHEITTYDPSGMLNGTYTLPTNVPFGDSQRSVLLKAPMSSVDADFTIPGSLTLDPAGGAVCWANIDCVAWGFPSTGGLPSPVGDPAPALPPAGEASLVRDISRGCPTALDAADDTNNSAADFTFATPSPRKNAAPPTETSCTSDTQGPGQTLTAKKKQDVDKAAVSETLSEAGTVTLSGKVKVPKASRAAGFRTLSLAARAVRTKKSTKSLAGNTKKKIKIKLSRNAKTKVKAAIEDSGPRKITVTATAKDAAGNSTTKKVRFKLTD